MSLARRLILVACLVSMAWAQAGGAGAASDSAAAAGDTVSTGSNAQDRTAPTTRQGFSQLLSGLFFGGIFFLLTAGCLLAQGWSYWESFHRRDAEKPVLQLGVAIILLVTGLQIAVIIHRLWEVHVEEFGNFSFVLVTIGWQLGVSYVCIGVSTAIAQAYFIHKCWMTYGRHPYVLVAYIPLWLYTIAGSCASAALELKAGSAANVRGSSLNSYKAGEQNYGYLFSVVFASWLVSNAMIDISLCFMLCRRLSQIKSPFFHTRNAVARMILTILETCVLTAGFSIASMILFLAVPQQFYYLFSLLSVGTVYGNSLIATLMLRPSIARELAVDKDSRFTRETLETAARSQRAPNTIAKPIIKRIMRKEQERMAAEQGVQITTVIDQVRSRTTEEIEKNIVSNALDHGSVGGKSTGSLSRYHFPRSGGQHPSHKITRTHFDLEKQDPIRESNAENDLDVDIPAFPVTAHDPSAEGTKRLSNSRRVAAGSNASDRTGSSSEQGSDLTRIDNLQRSISPNGESHPFAIPSPLVLGQPDPQADSQTNSQVRFT